MDQSPGRGLIIRKEKDVAMPNPNTLSPFAPSQLPARAVQERFSQRPTITSVVANTLLARLKEHYPTLDFDPMAVKLASPHASGGWTLKLLIEVAIEHLLAPAPLDFSPRDPLPFYLTLNGSKRLNTRTAPYLDMQVVARILADLPLTLYIDYQQALVDYWNQTDENGVSHCQWLSEVLKGQLKTAGLRPSNLNEAQRQALLQVANTPDRQERNARPGRSVDAWFLETTFTKEEQEIRRQGPEILLQQQNNVLLCHVDGRVEVFNSMQAFNDAWGRVLRQQYQVDHIGWKRYEPDDSLFEVQAGLILNGQLGELETFQASSANGLLDLVERTQTLTDPSILFIQTPLADEAPLTPVYMQLPGWLQQTSPSDRLAYRQYLLDLAEVAMQGESVAPNEELDDIRTFSRKALRSQMQIDHGQQANFDPDDLELVFAVAAGYPGGAGIIEHVRLSLTDLALKNLAGKPGGRMTVSHKQGLPLPAWLDESYLLGSQGLIQRVDIGKVYPEKIKDLLLSDSDDARRREKMYSRQLRVQLPMLALEQKIRKQSGFTEKGHRYVAALVGDTTADRTFDEQEIVLRPLAFHRKPGADPDTVEDMFLIEPRDLNTGPCILYRPQYAIALLEFPTREVLFEAIAQSGELQDSILAWLPDRARSIYANNGFNEPHINHFHLGDEFNLPQKPAPACLAGDEGADELFQALSGATILSELYGSNARALVNLADRDSVSNAESRWKVFFEGAGLLFNTLLLPLARGPLMLVGWMLVLIDSLEKDLSGLGSDDPKVRELALIDLLLNTAMVLLHLAPTTEPAQPPLRRPAPDKTEPSLASWRSELNPHKPETVQIRPETIALTGEPVGSDRTPLDFITSTASAKSTQKLMNELLSFHVPWPENLPPAQASGPFKGLYQIDGIWHASTGGLLFKVSIVPGFGEVYLIDPVRPDHPGFKLSCDGQGHWRLDRGLKLRGGGPKNRRQAKLAEIRQQLEEINLNKPALELQLERQITQSSRTRTSLGETVNQLETATRSLQAAWAALDQAEGPAHAATNLQYTNAVRLYADLNRTGAIQSELLVRINEQLELTCGELLNMSRRSQALEPSVDHAQRQTELLTGLATGYILAMAFGLEAEKPSVTSQGEPVKKLFLRQKAELREGNPTGYREMIELFQKKLQIKEQNIDLAGRLDRIYNELDQFRLGREARQALKNTLVRPQLNDRTNALIDSLAVLKTLTFDHSHAMNDYEQYLFDLEVSDLRDAITVSHMNLRVTAGFTADERAQALSTIIDRYKRSLSACQDMLEMKLSPERADYQQRFISRITEVIGNAEAELAEIVRSETDVPAQTTVSKPQREHSLTKRVFKTRNKGTLVGDLLPATEGEADERIEVRDPVSGQVVARFHKHPTEKVYVEQLTASTPEAVTPRPPRSLTTVRKESSALKARQAQIELSIQFQQKKMNDPARLEIIEPRDWDDMLAHHAEKLEALSKEAEALVGDDAAVLAKTLQEEASEVTRIGRQYCAEGYKKQRPQVQKVDFLWRYGFVDISEVTRLKKLATGDYLTEYAIREKNSPNVLWFAHFHYPSLDTPHASYSFAHLKIPAQRFQTYKDLLRQAAADNTTVVNLRKSIIEPPLDERLFLNL
ncbi:dermonecrotic toxin domain-containing protein [Pseudomonas sp. P8_241]|uniref:dermonecrotic toxin domain-containing protein n=1 Tax=Pseudomonas sp. P8_241 TaxID=3043445 RepID=UPI002A36A1B8|nr:DUF6543 domain-containing protein [Pseudomonas sp. P8_241]WPN44937.1 hypothetical protein QMK58_17255 [Pseudomonas sp. P8_241]